MIFGHKVLGYSVSILRFNICGSFIMVASFLVNIKWKKPHFVNECQINYLSTI